MIENFNKPVFAYNKYGCITESLRLNIIECFQKHLPREPLFNEKWNKMAGQNFSSKEITDTTNIKNYLNAVIDVFYKTYNVRPLDPAPEPILIKRPDCGEPEVEFDKG